MMSSEIFEVRPSAVLKHDDCPSSYDRQYLQGVRTEATSINLPFGTAVHDASTGFLEAEHFGRKFDPETVFMESFESKLEASIIEVSSMRSIKDYVEIGRRLVGDFPAAWENTGLTILLDKEGNPVIERRLKAQVAPGVILTGTPDIAALDDEGDVAVVDIKTPAQISDPLFLWASDQLTSYQILLEHNADLIGLDGVQKLGFFEGVKRKVPVTGKGRGPTWEPMTLGLSRNDAAKHELVEKILEIKRNRDRGYFPRRSRMAYNTPCTMCDFRHWCLTGDTDGLVFPEQRRVEAERIKLPASF